LRVAWITLVTSVALMACGVRSAPAEIVIGDVLPDFMEGDLELAITPTPQRTELTEELLRVGTIVVTEPSDAAASPRTLYTQLAERVGDGTSATPTRLLVGGPARNPTVAALIGSLELPGGVEDRGAEAYQLYAGPDPEVEGGTLVVLAGATPQADFWAFQSFVQLVAKRGRERYVRRAAISDWPSIPLRGNKRPQVWEHRFKANFAWRASGDQPEFAAVFRTEGAWVHEVGELDVENASWMRSIERSADAALARGVRDCIIKFDDTPTTMTRGTAHAYGDYYAAQATFVRRFRAWLRDRDPQARLVFLPQAYWTNAFDIVEQTRGLATGGGIPGDIALCITGQEVISRSIPSEAVRRARELFGLTERRAWIYDNAPRGGDLGPYRGRDPRLAEEVGCLFAERGTAVTRITLYDFAWNPAAYDAERSWKLACRELAEGDRKVYRALLAYVTAWDAAQYPLTGGESARETLRVGTRRARGGHAGLRAMFEGRTGLATQSGFVDQLVVNSPGDTAALEERSGYLDRMLRHGYRTGKARRTEETVSIDGRLDDAAWKRAQPLGGFVYFRDGGPSEGGAGPAPPLAPDAEQTEVRLLWDDDALLVSARLRHRRRPKLSETRRQLAAGERRPGAWRVPAFEILLDADRDRSSYFHIILNLEGWYSESHAEGFGTDLDPGPWWRSGVEFATATGEHESVIEARIPFAALGGRPAAGDRWHAQFARNVNGASTWSYQYEFFGFRWPQHFGTVTFEE
jgi:hypothetical protein